MLGHPGQQTSTREVATVLEYIRVNPEAAAEEFVHLRERAFNLAARVAVLESTEITNSAAADEIIARQAADIMSLQDELAASRDTARLARRLRDAMDV